MKHSDKTVKSISKIKSYILYAALAWTVIIGLSLIWNILNTNQQTLARADVMARLAFDKDTSFRTWVTNHGGVYVPVTDETTPNPYLHVPDRDVTTRSGKNLTLMNPAYMMRQYYEKFEKKGGVRGHITSLKPLRPENKPDPWEEQILLSFEAGKKEATIIQTLDGDEYVRFMKPFIITKGCLKCHAGQGYKEGDIRGGISVSVPMSPLQYIERYQMLMLSVVHTLLWLIGLAGIIIFGRVIQKSERLRCKTEEALAETHKHTKTILESISDSFFTLNNNMVVTYFNRAAENTLGRKHEEVVGHKLFDVFPEARGSVFEDKYTEALTKKISLSFETYFGGPPYSNWYDVRVYTNPEGISIYFQVITERKKLEAQLLLTQKMEAIGELAGGIAHDFNNLLQSIIMGIATAKTRSHEDNVREILIQAEHECLKAEELSNLLITFSKGGIPVVHKSSIKDMLKETVLLVLKGSPVNTEFVLADDLWPVEIDERQIRIAISQMVMNAKEAMPSGGLLKVQARNLESVANESLPLEEGKYVKVTFADNGAGISPENLSKIFDPYFTTKQMGSQKGRGLSLTVSQSIIKKHKGIITVESKVGAGATFHIYLPAAKDR